MVTCNGGFLAAIVAALTYAPIFRSLDHAGADIVGTACAFMPIPYTVALVLNHARKQWLARVLFCLSAWAFLALCASFLGTAAGGHLWLFAYAGTTFAMFPYAEVRSAIALAFLGFATGLAVVIVVGSTPVVGGPLSPSDATFAHATLWIGTFAYMFTMALTLYLNVRTAENALDRERERSDSLLLNVLPAPIAARLKDDERTIADGHAQVTVLFADIAGFTPMSSRLRPEEVVAFLNEIFSAFDTLVERHGLEKIKTIGDAYMAAAGVPVRRPDHAQAAARLALDMVDTIERIAAPFGERLQMRIGLNTGPVVAGVIGTRKFAYDLWGDTVNTASRMESHGVGGSIQLTESTWEHLRTDFALEERGVIDVKGKGAMRTWFLRGARDAGDFAS